MKNKLPNAPIIFIIAVYILCGCGNRVAKPSLDRTQNSKADERLEYYKIIDSAELGIVPGIKYSKESQVNELQLKERVLEGNSILFSLYEEVQNWKKDTSFVQLERENGFIFYKKRSNSDKGILYYFNDEKIRRISEWSKSSFEKIELFYPKENLWKVYYTDRNKNRIFRNRSFVSKAFENSSVWKINVDSFLNDRKKILGFDCFKVVITYTNLKVEGAGQRIEAYVTKEIENLDFAVFSDYRKPYLQLCPLEYVVIENTMPFWKKVFKAVEILKADSSIIEIPEEYSNAKKFKHSEDDPQINRMLDSLEREGYH